MIFRLCRAGFASLLVIGAFGCSQTQNPSSGTPVQSNPPPQAASPPQQQPLSLYFVPLNPTGFSMETIQANKRKVEQEPNNVEALVSLADANFMIQRFEKSQEYYERALKINPKLVNPRLSLSNTYLFMQKVDESLKQLDELLATQKDLPEALYNKGIILLESKGDRAGAKQAWTQLMQSHPDHELAQHVKGELGKM